MNLFSFLFFIAFFVVSVSSSPAEKYATRFDNFDVDAVLNNKRIFNNYMKCVMSRGSCTPQGREFKKLLPEVIATNCAKCNPNQEKIIRKVTRRIKEESEDNWTKLLEEFDQGGVHRDSFEKYIYSA